MVVLAQMLWTAMELGLGQMRVGKKNYHGPCYSVSHGCSGYGPHSAYTRFLYKLLEFSGLQALLKMGWEPQFSPTKEGNFWQGSIQNCLQLSLVPAISSSFIFLSGRSIGTLALQLISIFRLVALVSLVLNMVWWTERGCWLMVVRKHHRKPVSRKALRALQQTPLPKVFSRASSPGSLLIYGATGSASPRR